MIYYYTSDYFLMCTSVNLSVLKDIYMYEDKEDTNLTVPFNSIDDDKVLVYFQTDDNKKKYLNRILKETDYKHYEEHDSIYIFSIE